MEAFEILDLRYRFIVTRVSRWSFSKVSMTNQDRQCWSCFVIRTFVIRISSFVIHPISHSGRPLNGEWLGCHTLSHRLPSRHEFLAGRDIF
jgi:hypothetical protein